MQSNSIENDEFHSLFTDMIREYQKKYPEDDVFSELVLQNSRRLCALRSKEEADTPIANNVFVYPH